jgi:hypothetical protein
MRRWSGHVANMGERRNAHRSLGRNLLGADGRIILK